MKRTSFGSRARAAFVAGVATLALAAFAQDVAKKPPPRLPPTGSQTSDIPAGVDTGTPATSNAMQLGTPVPPALAADRGDQNKRSAAARAAARPASSASASASGGIDCVAAPRAGAVKPGQKAASVMTGSASGVARASVLAPPCP